MAGKMPYCLISGGKQHPAIIRYDSLAWTLIVLSQDYLAFLRISNRSFDYAIKA